MQKDLQLKRRESQFYINVFDFLRIFNLELKNYWNKRAGLNTAKLYRKLGVPSKVVPLKWVEEKYGHEAVELIKRLI